jgi:hypothetical protein
LIRTGARGVSQLSVPLDLAREQREVDWALITITDKLEVGVGAAGAATGNVPRVPVSRQYATRPCVATACGVTVAGGVRSGYIGSRRCVSRAFSRSPPFSHLGYDDAPQPLARCSRCLAPPYPLRAIFAPPRLLPRSRATPRASCTATARSRGRTSRAATCSGTRLRATTRGQ